jgi:hypothetical protein
METMRLDPNDFDPSERPRIHSIKKDAAVSTGTMSLKADENVFRRRNFNVVDDLFAKMWAEKNGAPYVENTAQAG